MTEGVVFTSHRGLKQGCPLSPLLFALYIADLEHVLKRNQLGGVFVGRKKFYNLAFADDLVLLAYTPNELKDMMRALQRFATGKHLVIYSVATNRQTTTTRTLFIKLLVNIFN